MTINRCELKNYQKLIILINKKYKVRWALGGPVLFGVTVTVCSWKTVTS